MFRVLLKKQLMELAETYTPKKQRGKGRRSIGFLRLYVFLFVMLGFSLGTMLWDICAVLNEVGLDWFYFLIVMTLALAIGVVGSVFSAYSTIYRAKDNETLLAMPIPTGALLASRMAAVLFTGLVFELIVFLPGCVVYFAHAGVSFAALAGSLLGVISVSLICLSLTCFFGWVVALISVHTRNKSFITVLVSLLLIAAYYLVYFRIAEFLNEIALNAVTLSEKVSAKAAIVKLFAQSFIGNAQGITLLLALALVLTALTVEILYRSFDRIVTTEKGRKRAVYKQTAAKSSGSGRALMRKELRHFTQNPAYILNCGLGLFFMLGLTVYALIKFSSLRETIGGYLPALSDPENGMYSIYRLICAAPGLIMALFGAMCPISAPSISLEGQSMWLLRSLPVSAKRVLSAKQAFHLAFVLPLSLIATAVLSALIGLEAGDWAANLIFVAAYQLAISALGLVLGLKRPSFDWTDESVPVKRGMAISITLLAGMALPSVMAIAVLLLGGKFDLTPYLWIVPLAIALWLNALLYRWGIRRFEEIG